MRRFAILLSALLLPTGLLGCTDSSLPPTPTRSAVQATARANAKIVTDLSQLATTPTASAVPTATQLSATSTPQPIARLELQSFRYYRDAVGSLWVVGEARNTGDTTATGVDFRVSLVGADGKPVATTFATSHLALVAPGALTPFRAMFSQPPKDWTEVTVDVTAGPPDPNDTSSPSFVESLKVEHAAVASTAGAVAIGGDVKNAGTEAAMAVRVLAVLRGADGKVVDVADSYAKTPDLAAGASSPFSVQFYDGKTPGPFEVFVQGRYAARDLVTPTR
jgi:hypothetical protein